MDFWDICEAMSTELYKKNTDWNRVTELVKSLGPDINLLFDEENTVLSEMYGYVHMKKGEEAIRLTRLFLDCGFDVTAHDGFNGFSCLSEMCNKFDDWRMLPIAEMLIDAGADLGFTMDYWMEGDSASIVDVITDKLDAWMIGEYSGGNSLSAYLEMISRASDCQPYRGIRDFHDAKGLKVTKVEMITSDKKAEDEHSIGEGLILWCENVPLVINEYVEVRIDPYATEAKTEDASEEYKDIIGMMVKELRYKSQSSARLHFYGSKYIFFESQLVDKGDPITKGIIKDSKTVTKFEIGDFIKSIGLKSEEPILLGCGETNREEIYLETDTKLFHISGINVFNNKKELCIDEVPKSWGKTITWQTSISPLCVEEVEYSGNRLKRLCLKGLESKVSVLIRPDSGGFFSVACIISKE